MNVHSQFLLAMPEEKRWAVFTGSLFDQGIREYVSGKEGLERQADSGKYFLFWKVILTGINEMMDTAISFDESGYLNFFGFHINPFPIAPDSDYFYESPQIEQIVTELIHGIITRKGFLILTGEVGLGKTTISRRMLKILDSHQVQTSLVLHTGIKSFEVLKEINRDFGVYTESILLSEQMAVLNQFLLERNKQGQNCVIIIDDAQNLDFESFELIRMISNLEADRQKLVQILLVGQPELLDKLNSHELRQLKSRISIRKTAHPLNLEEIQNYLFFKLNSAGSNGVTSIDVHAIQSVSRLTKGNLRQINVLMDRCLYVAFVYDTTRITKKIILEAHADLNQKEVPVQKKKIFQLLLSGFLVVGVITGGAMIILKNTLAKPSPAKHNPSLPGVVQTSFNRFFLKELSASVQTATTPPSQVEPDRPKREKANVPLPVRQFLSTYHLDTFAIPFNEALNSGQLDQVKKNIFNKTGLMLIELYQFNEDIRNRYGLLSCTFSGIEKKTYLLFWKPELRISRFYYHYRGEEITHLQQMLSEYGFYHQDQDGIVGINTMKAVNHLQEKSGIPVTGFPDDRTLFWLCQNKRSVNECMAEGERLRVKD
ncbi:MAG: AAA family ATPase [Proteobacteria bacterium]|nr:AAA family ATPase [Pseudomonadota bacterium]